MAKSGQTILVIDVGGTKVKVGGTGRKELLRIPSGPKMTAHQMVKDVKAALQGWKYDAVSIGFPGPVRENKIVEEPVNLGTGWTTIDFPKAFGAPVKLLNDAAMQALGSYEGGNMLFLGLGTGLGSAMVVDGHVAPLELAHLPYRKGLTYEDYLGIRGLERLGKKRWRHHVAKVVKLLAHGMQAGYVVLGGGQTKELKELPEGVKLGNNLHAIEGGLRLWR